MLIVYCERDYVIISQKKILKIAENCSQQRKNACVPKYAELDTHES